MSTKFFPAFMRALVAAFAVVAPQFIDNLIAFFQGGAPSDVSTTVWAIASGVAIFVFNWILSKLRSTPPALSARFGR